MCNVSELLRAGSIIALASAPVLAGVVKLDFQLTTSNGNPVTDLFIYSTAPGQENLYAAPDILAPAGVQTLTYTVPFDPVSTLIVGINPQVGAEGAHIVMFADEGFALSAEGVKWSAFFSPVRHSEFLNWLADAHQGDPTALGSLSTFFRGSQASAAAFASQGPATILQWSIGGPIGAVIPETPVSGVALLGVGLMSWAFMSRRRRK